MESRCKRNQASARNKDATENIRRVGTFGPPGENNAVLLWLDLLTQIYSSKNQTNKVFDWINLVVSTYSYISIGP